MLRIGLDEAGYGPTLGPLVLAATAAEFAGAEVCPWSLDFGDTPLRVGDSKAIYRGHTGHSSLERTALGFWRAAGRSILELESQVTEAMADSPWYGALPSIPCWISASEVETAAQQARKLLKAASITAFDLHIRAVAEPAFNRGVEKFGNKAAFHFDAILGLLRATAASRPFDATVDRLGGRKHYAPGLAETFGCWVGVEEEGPRSAYTLGQLGRVAFEVGADARHYWVALASMVAKYIRELLMQRYNHYWTGLIPDLRPTAGYPQDARRFLAELEPHAQRLGFPIESLRRIV